ncbi:MAG TPA: HNH endonuclease [Thermoanaerobaculia bacterium]|nr:HNH endonuclease [Thermoanaerobaculia bacterium]
MAVTKGHGNPDWIREEIVLALDLYFDCRGRIPSASDPRVRELSEVLRAFPHHSAAATRRESFRNADGVVFKLQNLRQVDTGKGLGHISRTDREVWAEFGVSSERTKAYAQLIRAGIEVVGEVLEESAADEVFAEGRVVTEAHLRRERDQRLRARLIDRRRSQSKLRCEICGREEAPGNPTLSQAIFEVHHIVPLAVGAERKTKLADMALLCACCHRMVHRAIAIKQIWLSIEEAKKFIEGA